MGDRPTIYDVARAAGVAASTVSRAYARPGRVNSETARVIFEAAERIGYRSARITGTLGRRTGAVALMISDITNPFYNEIIKGAAEATRDAGYALLLADTSESGHVEREAVERTLDLVEGVLLTSSRMSDSAIRMIAKQKPVVLLNRRIPEISCIITDNARGMRRAVEHLGELGHRPITYVAGPEASWADGVRWRALREAATSWSCGCSGSTRQRPDRAHAASRRPSGSPTRRDRGARLQRRAGDRRHQGTPAARRARSPTTSASSGSTTSCSPRSSTRADHRRGADAQGGRTRRRQRAGPGPAAQDAAARRWSCR